MTLLDGVKHSGRVEVDHRVGSIVAIDGDSGAFSVGASVFEVPVEVGEVGGGRPRGIVKIFDSTLAGGRPILRVRDNVAELS